MADLELEQLIAGLRSSVPDLAAPIEKTRAAFEAMLATIPIADDIAFAEADLGGVPGLKATMPGAAEDAVLLYLHGGAYVIGSARGYRALAAELGRAAGMTVHAIDYRLAPEHPCPAAVEDTVTAYRALLGGGISPARIAIVGDSAGGGLTLATLVGLRDRGVPLPAAALLISPWADLACEGASITAKAEEDPALTAEGLRLNATRYLQGGDLRQPLASPINADLSGLPPILVQVGSAEILLDDAVRVAGAAGAAGTRVRLDVWPDMIHVWHAFAFMLTAGRQAIAEAGAFLAGHVARDAAGDRVFASPERNPAGLP